MIKNLRKQVKKFVTVDIHGGWVGVLASLMFQSEIGPSYKHIRSIDIDPTCEPIATMMNKKEEIAGKFRAVSADMCDIRSDADVVINTSCEHITQDQYDLWLSGMPYNSLLILQSNNYNIPEHVRTSDSLEAFKDQCKIKVVWAEELELFDDVMDQYQMLIDYIFNIGNLEGFPKMADAVVRSNLAAMKKEYKRTGIVRGKRKELTARNTEFANKFLAQSESIA